MCWRELCGCCRPNIDLGEEASPNRPKPRPPDSGHLPPPSKPKPPNSSDPAPLSKAKPPVSSDPAPPSKPKLPGSSDSAPPSKPKPPGSSDLPPLSKPKPAGSSDLPPPSKPKPAGEGDASQSMAGASGSVEKSGTQSTMPNKGDPYHQKPKVQVDTINQPTQPNNGGRTLLSAIDPARTPYEGLLAKDQTKARDKYGADDGGAEKVEKVPKKENVGYQGAYRSVGGDN